MEKSETIPLSELDGFSNERVTWRLNLPEYAQPEDIGVNIGRIGKLARLGGLGHLTVDGEAGEVTRYEPTIVGSDTQGNAFAGNRISIKKADLQGYEMEEQNSLRRRRHEYFWPATHVKVNTSEITDRINSAKKRGSLRDPGIWSGYLDQAIKTSIRSASYQNLVTDIDRLDKSLAMLMISSPALSPYPKAALFNFLQVSATFNILSSLIGQASGLNIKDRRLSLLPILHLDRLVALQGISRATKVVKDLKKKN